MSQCVPCCTVMCSYSHITIVSPVHALTSAKTLYFRECLWKQQQYTFSLKTPSPTVLLGLSSQTERSNEPCNWELAKGYIACSSAHAITPTKSTNYRELQGHYRASLSKAEYKVILHQGRHTAFSLESRIPHYCG